VATNLRLCFPEKSEAERRALAREHFALLGRSLLERGLLWWASEQRLRRLLKLEGIEHIVSDGRRKSEQPLILLVPHFLGLDVGGSTLAMPIDAVSLYSQQKDGAVDAPRKHGRQRFGDQQMLARHEGRRATVKALRAGRPFYYLPDM